MKKYLTILLFILVGLVEVSAAKPILFKGIDLEKKSIKDIDEKIFELPGTVFLGVDQRTGWKIYKGTFAGRQCKLSAESNPAISHDQSAPVVGINAVFEREDGDSPDWNWVEDTYLHLKHAFNYKYGSGTCIEEFNYPYSKSDAVWEKTEAVRMEEVTYKSVWIDNDSNTMAILLITKNLKVQAVFSNLNNYIVANKKVEAKNNRAYATDM